MEDVTIFNPSAMANMAIIPAIIDLPILKFFFSKCFGVVGGVAAASKEIIDYLRISAKIYIFSGTFLGALIERILKSLAIIKRDINEEGLNVGKIPAI